MNPRENAIISVQTIDTPWPMKTVYATTNGALEIHTLATNL